MVSRLWRQAALYLETARDVAPPDRRSEVLRLLAVSYNGQGQRQAAVSAAEQAVASDPDSIEALQLLVQIHMESEQREKALERAKDMVAAAERKRKLDMSGRQALQDLISANQTQLQTLVAYYTSLCRRDVRGRFTDQIEPGSEAEAVRVLSEIAYQSEQVAKLNWEFSYYQTLALLEPVVGFQTDQTRYLLRNNTRYLLDLGSLYLATHQDERAVEFFRAVIAVESPSDTNPAPGTPESGNRPRIPASTECAADDATRGTAARSVGGWSGARPRFAMAGWSFHAVCRRRPGISSRTICSAGRQWCSPAGATGRDVNAWMRGCWPCF